jgi:hypothetical protein
MISTFLLQRFIAVLISALHGTRGGQERYDDGIPILLDL